MNLFTKNFLLSTGAKSWLLSLVAAVGLFFAIRPAFAQAVESQVELAEFLQVDSVEVGDELNDGRQKIYYLFNDNKVYVSDPGQNTRHPHSNGEYIVWAGDIRGAGQIYRYHIPSGTTLRITNSSTNLNPMVARDGSVVWERWVSGAEFADSGLDELSEGWQVFLFDGTKTIQLTRGDETRNPYINGNFISYGRRDVSGTWRSVVYSISEEKAADVTTGIASKKPRVTAGGEIMLAGTGISETFPLTVDDLFLLDLSALTATESASAEEESTPQTVTEEEIAEELEGSVITATDSAEQSEK